MGIPSGRFSIYEGTEIISNGRLSFSYKTRGDGHYAPQWEHTKWLAIGQNESSAAHFVAVDGKDEGDGWSCRMRIVDGNYDGYWLDSSDGWLCAVGSSKQRWKFLGNGEHYEWWQGERPVVVRQSGPNNDGASGFRLRAEYGANPRTYTVRPL
ncbi:hypothetical protein [Nonomuraea dietziae]|uniref:hypothetical protein n=1 Tax=Nonomuraea dietziae TaxID=65515 RepID=UPI0033FF4441